MKIKKLKIIIIFVLIFAITIGIMVFCLVNKWNDYVLPYNNVDVASKDFFDINSVSDYESIKHYIDTIQYHLLRKPIPVFLVDIVYESNVYEENKRNEMAVRNINFEFEIDDFMGIVISESNEKALKAVCFCDELKIIRYIVIYYKDFTDFYDEIESFESELDVCLYGIGCKWSISDIENKNPDETIPEKILWQR